MRRPPPASDLARRDPAVPALGPLLDPEGAARAVARAVGEEPAAPPTVEYARHKPGVSALLLWRARLGDGTLARVYAKAYAEGDRPALDAAKAAGRLRAGERAPFAALDQARAVAFAFPFDAGLPGLRRLFRTDGAKRALARAFPERGEAGWRPKARGTSLEIVRYKPENRCVFRAEVLWKRDADGRRERSTLFGRTLPRGGAERGSLVCAALGSIPGARVPRPAGIDVESGTLFLEALPGAPLLEAAGREEAFKRTGRALASLHGARADLPAAEPAADRIERLRRECAAYADLGEPWAGGALAVLDRIGPASFAARGAVHGDFHAEQVLLEGEEVAFVDLDAAGAGAPSLDLGSFLGHLRLLVRSGDLGEEEAERAAEAFLRGYGAAPAGFEPACALALLDIGLSAARRLEASASERLSGIVEEACALLGGPRATRAAIRNDGTVEVEYLRATPTGRRMLWEIAPPEGERRIFEDPIPAGPEGLRVALDPGALSEALRASVPGHGDARVARVALLSLRPGRRAALRAHLRGGSTLVVKAYVPGKVPAATAAPEAPNLRIPRRLGVAPASGLVFLEDLEGEPLPARLRGPTAEADLRACGEALRAFHGGALPAKIRGLAKEIETATHRHSCAVRRGGPGGPERADALERLAGLARESEPAAHVRLHGDFHEKQVLFGPEGIAFLDLDLAAAGDPALDAGNFLAHLELRDSQGDLGSGAADALRGAFLAGYGAGGPAFEERLPLFRAVSLVRLSALQAVRPGAGELAVELARRAREALCFARG